MYALMKANLFVFFPGHVIKYRGFSKRRKKTIDEYLNLQQDGRAMIAWSLNLLRRSVNLVACNMINTITLYSLSSDSFNVILNVFLVFFYFPVGEFYRSVFPNIISPEYGRKVLTWSTIIWGVKG